MSRICDEFPCLSPTTAIEEWRRVPVGFLEEVIEARHYMAAKRLVENTKHEKDLPDSPLVQLAQIIELELQAERMNRTDG